MYCRTSTSREKKHSQLQLSQIRGATYSTVGWTCSFRSCDESPRGRPTQRRHISGVRVRRPPRAIAYLYLCGSALARMERTRRPNRRTPPLRRVSICVECSNPWPARQQSLTSATQAARALGCHRMSRALFPRRGANISHRAARHQALHARRKSRLPPRHHPPRPVMQTCQCLCLLLPQAGRQRHPGGPLCHQTRLRLRQLVEAAYAGVPWW